jgi:hypothetical protein
MASDKFTFAGAAAHVKACSGDLDMWRLLNGLEREVGGCVLRIEIPIEIPAADGARDSQAMDQTADHQGQDKETGGGEGLTRRRVEGGIWTQGNLSGQNCRQDVIL